MLPSTFLGVLLFLWLVTPGFLFSLLAARRRATAAESAFHETARTVVSSVVFTSLGAGVAALVVAASPATISLARLIVDSQAYVGSHAGSLGLFLSVQIATACLLAWGADGLERQRTKDETGQDPPELRTVSAWDEPLDGCPPGTSTRVWLRLRSGIEFLGKLGGVGREIDVDERELLLVPPIEIRYPKQGWQTLRHQRLVVQGSDIEFLATTYPKNPEPDSA
jgi:hypothetical protein